MVIRNRLLQAAAGNATGGAGLDIDEVFSTYLYTGTGSTQTITNGIDLDGEGGLVWFKHRAGDGFGGSHWLIDTERGGTKFLQSQSTGAQSGNQNYISAFNVNGFTIGTGDAETNYSSGNSTYASWTFRKAPKFFDVVTYTGDGTDERDIAHNLGGPVGCLMVKCTSEAADWQVLHKDANRLVLNSTAAQYSVANTAARFGDDVNIIRPTATHFTVSTPGNADTNKSGATYVAYLFAHNDGDGEFGPSGDQDIIKCGSYAGGNYRNGELLDLGFEPQWILIKNATDTSALGDTNWVIVDAMRGMSHASEASLYANLSNAEYPSSQDVVAPDPQGFRFIGADRDLNRDGDDYIYMAIRRGPLAPPESGTEVFNIDISDSASEPRAISGFPVDMAIRTDPSKTQQRGTSTRLTQGKFLYLNNTNAEATTTNFEFDYNNGTASILLTAYYYWMWKRAPGFFDVVAYTGAGSQFSQKHNLGVTPQLIITKRRDSTGSWLVYTEGTGLNTYLLLNSSAAVASATNYSAVSDTHYTVPFGSTGDYVSYLFASLDGISKVGSYTGNGSSQTIDCNFTSGARFILIKRTDSTGDWYVWDTERGIVAGNDPHLSLNTDAAEVTSDDSIDPDNSGFIVNQVSATNINVSSADYIFYAIA